MLSNFKKDFNNSPKLSKYLIALIILINFVFFCSILLLYITFFVAKAESISMCNLNVVLKDVFNQLHYFEKDQMQKNHNDFHLNSSCDDTEIFFKYNFRKSNEIIFQENKILLRKIFKKLLNTRIKRETEMSDSSSFKKKSARVKKISSTTNTLATSPIQEYFYITNKNLTTKETKDLVNSESSNDHFLIQAFSKISVRYFVHNNLI
jgi:hypothetical protein